MYLTSIQPASMGAGAKITWRSRSREHELWSTKTGNTSAKFSWNRKKVEGAVGSRPVWPPKAQFNCHHKAMLGVIPIQQSVEEARDTISQASRC